MKIIRGIFSTLFGFILFDVILVLLLSFSLKTVISDGLIKEVVSKTVNEEITKNIEAADTAIIEDASQNEIIGEFLGDYSDELTEQIFNALTDPEANEDVDITKDLVDYIREHKSEIESKYNVTISEEQLDEILENQDIKNMNDEYVNQLKNSTVEIGEGAKDAIKAYKYVISDDFKIGLGIAAVVLTIIIALIQWSWFKWMRTLGNAILFGGISMLISGFSCKTLVDAALTELELDINFDVSMLYNTGFIAIGVGVLLFIIYQIIKHVVKSKNKDTKSDDKEVEDNDISEMAEL